MTQPDVSVIAQRKRDEAWSCLAELAPDIHRIARQGPDGSDRDFRILMACVNAAAGELHMMEAGAGN